MVKEIVIIEKPIKVDFRYLEDSTALDTLKIYGRQVTRPSSANYSIFDTGFSLVLPLPLLFPR